MKTKYQIRTSKLLLAVGLAPLLPALIHAVHYFHTPFFYWAIPIAAAFSYLLTILLVLPGYLVLLRHGRFNLKHVALFTGLVGICLGFTLFALNNWGTGGYSYYGEFGYRTVELGKLTLAGYVLAGLRIFYFFALALVGGISFYFIAKNRPADSNG